MDSKDHIVLNKEMWRYFSCKLIYQIDSIHRPYDHFDLNLIVMKKEQTLRPKTIFQLTGVLHFQFGKKKILCCLQLV